MFWASLLMMRVVIGLIGAFGTAYMHERSGRDVTMGGLIGLVVGFVGGLFFLMLLWVWLYYVSPSPVGRIYERGGSKRWYQWWN